MGRADIGKDIARASLCLHLNNKTLHVRPAVTPPRQRALTRFHGRGPNSQPLPFLPRASPLSKRLSRYGNRDGTRAFLRGTSWERRFLRAEPRYTRQSFLETSKFFQSPNLEFQVLFFFSICPRGGKFFREFLNNYLIYYYYYYLSIKRNEMSALLMNAI